MGKKKRKGKWLFAGGVLCLLLLVFVGVSGSLLLWRGQSGTVKIDFSKDVGPIKPLNGINNGPASGYEKQASGEIQWKLDVTDLFQDMGIPYVRTHDTEYPYGQDLFVDIHCIFPDFSADVNDPASYRFQETDEYIKQITESGSQVFFRLGESIDHSGENRYTRPPEDVKKWAEICEHIVRHYNEYWASGFSYGITYWEIWNEPDSGSMWRGEPEEYYELYQVTASYLKETHPEIKVGGGAFSYPEEELVIPFLETISAQKTPLDFFSWHTYTGNPITFAQTAQKVRDLLDQYGYTETESVLDEWNYLEGWEDQTNAVKVRNSLQGGTFLAASLIAMQNSPVDLAMYYDGQYVFADYYCGLYDSQGNPKPGYYSFLFWQNLNRLGSQAEVKIEGLQDVYCCAASRDGENGILLANYREVPANVTVRYSGGDWIEKIKIVRVNEDHLNGVVEEQCAFGGRITLRLDWGEVAYLSFSE